MSVIATSLPLFLFLFSPHALAQDEDDGDDDTEYSDEEGEESSSRKKKKKSSKKKGESAATQREIVRGVYAKVDVGGGLYLLDFADAVQAGTLVGLGVGQDFVDNEKQSMAWEVNILQGIHNGGSGYELEGQIPLGCGNPGVPCTQGDLRTYSLQASYEFSAYPARRIGIGFRLGAGALWSPLLIEESAYEVMLTEMGGDPGKHNAIHPYGFGGPAFEFYTNLNHFSVGINADAFYALGWDLGLNITGSFKYTF